MLRLEYAGAIYHVLNRGNYRHDLFQTGGEAQAFVKVLVEAVSRYGWKLHAYALMRNHYHLALETPEPNLVAGMHWLQSTFATRFNRLQQERGHLFQGRYQSLVIEDVAALSSVVDYIHLNPVRAHIVSIQQLAAFRWSSLAALVKGEAFHGLSAETWLKHLGLRPDAKGWHAYLAHLGDLIGDEGRQIELGFDRMSTGWAIGTDGWRKALARKHAATALQAGLPAAGLRGLREAKWEEAVTRVLAAAGRSEADLRDDAKFAAWKVALGVSLRAEGVPVTWLARRLRMGTPDSTRVYLSRANRAKLAD